MENIEVQLKKILYTLIFVLLCTSGGANAQNLSTEGTDFWLGFMNSWQQNSDDPSVLEIYISADDTTSGFVDIPLMANFSRTSFEVLPGIATSIIIPLAAMAQGTNNIEAKGIHVTSEKDVSVYAINKRRHSADMALILPSFSLSNNYYVMSHWEDGNRNDNANSDSEFLIVGIADDTQIEITPSVTTEGGDPAGTLFTITLNAGEIYQVQARADLTGTKVEGVNNGSGSCQNFALFAGNQYTQVGMCGFSNGHEHLFAQMYPVKTWGKEYITIPYEERIGGDVVKVLGAQDGTLVTVSIFQSGVLISVEITVDEGAFFTLPIDEVSVISADKPISVSQLARSSSCDNQSGDPFFIMLSPNDQLLEKITYNAPSVETVENYYLSIVTPTSSTQSMRLNNGNIGSFFDEIPGNPNFSFATLSTGGGNHTLQSAVGFIAYVYGYGDFESFGYATGAGLSNLSFDIEIQNDEGKTISSDSVCSNGITYFAPETNQTYDSYFWEFGDGQTTTTFNSDPVFHQYSETGTYILKVTGIIGGDNCPGGDADTEVQIVRVINPQLEIKGPRSVCPNTESVFYQVETNQYYENEWFIEGGTIINATKNSALVNWGATNDEASIQLLSINQNNCNGDTVIFPVKINIQLEPEAPFGEDSICFSNAVDLTYETYFIPGTIYDWQIENGEITEGQGTEKIELSWSEPGSGKLWFDQISTIDTLCDGTSDTLVIHIQRVPSSIANIVTDKTTYDRGEMIELHFEVDTLLPLLNLYLNGTLERDSVSSQEAVALTFDCSDTYNISIEAFDIARICPDIATGELNITVAEPEMEIIRVSNDLERDSVLSVSWQINQENTQEKPFFLQRNSNSFWLTLDTLQSLSSVYLDSEVRPKSTLYQYRIVSEDSCIAFYYTDVHQNILLNISQVQDEATLNWNDYENWVNGVDSYEIYGSIDGAPLKLYGNTSMLEFNVPNTNEGFDYCFRVKALEKEGNLSESWSNLACASFLPLVHAYNVFTPNGDDFNDTFQIDNITLYPNSELTIYDRNGTTVYEKRGYQNDWKGTKNGRELNGVFYYSLQLNDPRMDTDLFKGVVTILR